MKRFLFVGLFLLSLTHHSLSQLIVTNELNEPIPFVQLTAGTNFYAQSDLNGRVYNTQLNKLRALDTVFFTHVGYESIALLPAQILIKDTIKLKRKTFNLATFEINASQKPAKYQKIVGCYRSSQSNDNENAYFTDGKLEYYLKKKSFKYEINLLDHRAFKKSDIKTKPEHSVGIIYTAVGLPPIKSEYIPENYIRSNKLSIDSIDQRHCNLIAENGEIVVRIEIDEHFMKYSINDVFSRRQLNLFNTEVNHLDNDVILIFRNSGTETSRIKENFDDLVYYKYNHFSSVKHKKDDEYLEVRSQYELFVEQISDLETKPDIEFERNWGMPKNSSFSSEFWNKCQCEFYHPLEQNRLEGLELIR